MTTGFGNWSATGGVSNTNEFMLDGATAIMANMSGLSIIPTLDALQEFKIQTNGLSAEFGRTGGAVLNAVYIRKRLEPFFELPYRSPNMHEVVFSDLRQEAHGVRTGDIAKRLIDYGFHPYTTAFPLIVPGALMIEPTESEPKEELDLFIEAMKSIAEEVEEDPQTVLDAPHSTRVSRLDETAAARKPVLRWKPTS